MATLVFSAVGTLVGGPVGGVVGALVGRQVDSAILGVPNRQGPRLKELEATTSSYGTALPRHFGAMRVPGTIVWATDLVEHSATQSGGKSQPSVTSYSYTASFAVALGSRAISGIGRIWADGNLLRGQAGDLKTAGTMRIHHGHGDQAVDPLIAATEGADACPAYRGLPYVVFEDLDLGNFYNRIPALTFEVFADTGGFSLQDIVGELVDDVDAHVALEHFTGFSLEGPVSDTLALLGPLFTMDTDAGDDLMTIGREHHQTAPIDLPEAAISVDDGDFGPATGFARKRAPQAASPPQALRYYDTQRDYLPGVQRAVGQARPGQPQTYELPASLDAAGARVLVERLARRSDWARDQIAWRTAQLDPAVAPGAIVRVPERSGLWRVSDWEWRESGVELSLVRVIPAGADTPLGGADNPVGADPGQFSPPLDAPLPPSLLTAFELPWDGTGGGDAPALFAAVSSPGSNWAGAQVYVDHGDGTLEIVRNSGRVRAIVGTAETALPPASPHVFDRSSAVVVQLAAAEMELPTSTGRQLALGANRALLGSEVFQFTEAVALGDGRYRLQKLLRGRGGTEAAVFGHTAGERFVLLDSRPIALDPAIVSSAADGLIVAWGPGDDEPVSSPIALRGITTRPLAPVRARSRTLADGTLELCWTRRARGAWLWLDGVDTPLHEQAEAYRVTFGPAANPVATWMTEEPRLLIGPDAIAGLAAQLPGGAFSVRQLGSYAVSDPLLLAVLS